MSRDETAISEVTGDEEDRSVRRQPAKPPIVVSIQSGQCEIAEPQMMPTMRRTRSRREAHYLMSTARKGGGTALEGLTGGSMTCSDLAGDIVGNPRRRGEGEPGRQGMVENTCDVVASAIVDIIAAATRFLTKHDRQGLRPSI
jgi:hypothetical protein